MNPERMLVGAMMLGHNAVLDATEVIDASDLYDPRLAQIFQTIVDLDVKNAPTHPVAIVDRLTSSGSLERIGGAETIADLYGEAPSAGSAGYYAKIIKREAVRRRIRVAGAQIQQVAAEDGESDPASIIEAAHSLIDDASPGEATGLQAIGNGMDDILESLEGEAHFLPSPWRSINGYIDGFRGGALYVIGARPGAGKTIMGLQVATHLSAWGHVALSSLEMKREELQLRLLAQRGSIRMSSLGRHALTPSDWQKVANHVEGIRDLRIFIDDRAGVSMAQIRAHVRAVSRRGTLSAVVVDYLQLIRASDRRLSRYEAVTEFSRDLKVLARDFDVPVIALAQLNRQGEGGQRRPPTLSDLRDSGAIEQDADVVMLLQRGWDDAAQVPLDDLDVHVAKNRHGITGKTSLLWEGHFTRVSDSPWAE